MKHHIFLYIMLAAIVASCSNSSEGDDAGPQPHYESIDTVPLLVMKIQQCSRLYTAEYKIHKIVTHNDVLRLKGSFLKRDFNIRIPGDRKIAIPMDATMKAYIDFGTFSENNIERNGDKITIILPDPKVVLTSSKVDQKNIREYVSMTRSHFTDEEMSNYERQGRESIIRNITRMGILETARRNSALVLVPMLTQMGYKEENITIAYRRQWSEHDINSIVKTTD